MPAWLTDLPTVVCGFVVRDMEKDVAMRKDRMNRPLPRKKGGALLIYKHKPIPV